MAVLLFFASLLAFLVSQVRAVTLTSTSAAYTVNAESTNSFAIVVSRSSCDITSIKYMGNEVQYQSMGSHISSGLGTATVSAQTISSGGTNYVKITCTTSTLTHYMAIRDGDSSIHMMTSITAEPTVGELRWIARLNKSLLPNDDVNQASDIGGGTAIEGSDVFLVNGQTRSKFYSSKRFIDDQVHCLSGSTMKACMVLPGTAYETSSGGPFHRDIDTNPGDDYNTNYFYMNSGHAQTESYRTGLFGPYALQFSRSGTPSGSQDFQTLWSGLSVSGFVPAASRGYVSGKATGIDASKFKIVAHWYNSAAQYWAYADSDNNFHSPAMKPGTYTQVLYQDELKVATKSGVSVSAGATTTAQNIASTWTTPSTLLFQIGDWDGQPEGFRNADKQTTMHPSDSRMSSWGPLTYTVGSSALTDFPMAVFKDVNTPVTIKFTLTAAQASGAATLRVGTTLAFAGGRPQVAVNGKSYAAPAAPTDLNSRGVTRGTYRGLGEIYTFAVAAGTLVTGSNTVTIAVASGSSGTDFLEPNFIFDAVDLYR